MCIDPGSSTAWEGTGFGLAIHSDRPLLVPSRSPSTGELVELRRVEADTLANAWSESKGENLWRTRFPDGAQVTVERGATGEQRIAYGDLAAFEISAGGHNVRWAKSTADDAAVQRFLLDTVLWWTSMTRGFDLLHASAVKLADERVVAFVGGTGAGKTSLAIELISHGATLFADDVLALRREQEGVVIYPGPAVMNVPDASRNVVDNWTTAIAAFPGQGETWMVVDDVAREPTSLSAVIVLDRAAQNDLAIRQMTPSPLKLMTWAWGLTNTGERGLRSFEAFADLAESVPAYHLSAGGDASPGAIAKLITSRCR